MSRKSSASWLCIPAWLRPVLLVVPVLEPLRCAPAKIAAGAASTAMPLPWILAAALDACDASALLAPLPCFPR